MALWVHCTQGLGWLPPSLGHWRLPLYSSCLLPFSPGNSWVHIWGNSPFLVQAIPSLLGQSICARPKLTVTLHSASHKDEFKFRVSWAGPITVSPEVLVGITRKKTLFWIFSWGDRTWRCCGLILSLGRAYGVQRSPAYPNSGVKSWRKCGSYLYCLSSGSGVPEFFFFFLAQAILSWAFYHLHLGTLTG